MVSKNKGGQTTLPCVIISRFLKASTEDIGNPEYDYP